MSVIIFSGRRFSSVFIALYRSRFPRLDGLSEILEKAVNETEHIAGDLCECMLLSQHKWPLWSSLPARISSVKYGTTYSVQCRHWGRWIHAQKRLIFFNMPCHNSRHPQRSRTSIVLYSEQLNLMRRKNTYICAWCQRWFVTPLEKVGRDNNRTRNTFFYVELG